MFVCVAYKRLLNRNLSIVQKSSLFLVWKSIFGFRLRAKSNFHWSGEKVLSWLRVLILLTAHNYLCGSLILSALIWLIGDVSYLKTSNKQIGPKSLQVHKVSFSIYAVVQWHTFTLFCQQISVFMWDTDDPVAAPLQGYVRSGCVCSSQELLQPRRVL